MQLRVESSHEEGGMRDWSVNTVRFSGDADGNVTKLHGVRVGPAPKFEAIPGSEFEMDVDLVLLAMGFTGPVRAGMLDELGVAIDGRGNVATNENYMSSVSGVFAAGDMRRGQSLVCGHREGAGDRRIPDGFVQTSGLVGVRFLDSGNAVITPGPAFVKPSARFD